MAIYEAFNSDGASVMVSDVDLDEAARNGGPLSAELADAAAQARRTDLVEQLRRSLDGDDRARKLAAAKALLALDDRRAGALLESRAEADPDTVVAKSFIAVATRLRGPRAALELFEAHDTDPKLARLLVSNYNSHLPLEDGDIDFLVTALRRYIEHSLPWLATLDSDIWDNGVYLILNALSNVDVPCLVPDSERSEILRLLAVLPEHTDDDDIVSCASELRSVLSD